MANFKMRIEMNKLPGIGPQTHRKLGLVVKKTAFDVEADAKPRAPVDTGNLRNSIQAQSTGELSAEVNVGAEYGPYVEFGTHKMAAQPYLSPAVEAQRGSFEAAVKKVLETAGE